jgi:hypothetical protein
MCIVHQDVVQNGYKIPHNLKWIDLIVQSHTPVALALKRGLGKVNSDLLKCPSLNFFTLNMIGLNTLRAGLAQSV